MGVNVKPTNIPDMEMNYMMSFHIMQLVSQSQVRSNVLCSKAHYFIQLGLTGKTPVATFLQYVIMFFSRILQHFKGPIVTT